MKTLLGVKYFSELDSAKDNLLRASLESLKQLSQILTNILRLEATYVTRFECDVRKDVMPWLHLPYGEYTMPVRCPNHHFRAASAGRPCDHHTDLRASWLLRSCLTPHNGKFEKNRKPVARRHIVVTSYDPRTGTPR